MQVMDQKYMIFSILAVVSFASNETFSTSQTDSKEMLEVELNFAFFVYMALTVLLGICCTSLVFYLYYKFIILPPLNHEKVLQTESEAAVVKISSLQKQLCKAHEDNLQLREREISFFQKQQTVLHNNQVSLVNALNQALERITEKEGSPTVPPMPDIQRTYSDRGSPRSCMVARIPQTPASVVPTPDRQPLNVRETLNKSKFTTIPQFTSSTKSTPSFVLPQKEPSVSNSPSRESIVEIPTPPGSVEEYSLSDKSSRAKVRIRSHTFSESYRRRQNKAKARDMKAPSSNIIKKPLPFKFRMPTVDKNNLKQQTLESIRNEKMNPSQAKKILKEKSAAILPLTLKFDHTADISPTHGTHSAAIGKALDALLNETLSPTTSSASKELTADELFEKELEELGSIVVE